MENKSHAFMAGLFTLVLLAAVAAVLIVPILAMWRSARKRLFVQGG